MKFKDIKLYDLLWHRNQPGAFLVIQVGEAGAFVTDLFMNSDPMPLGLILPRDSDEWSIDDKSQKVSDEEKSIIEKRIELWRMVNNA